jgi:hypothetical protein
LICKWGCFWMTSVICSKSCFSNSVNRWFLCALSNTLPFFLSCRGSIKHLQSQDAWLGQLLCRPRVGIIVRHLASYFRYHNLNCCFQSNAFQHCFFVELGTFALTMLVCFKDVGRLFKQVLRFLISIWVQLDLGVYLDKDGMLESKSDR